MIESASVTVTPLAAIGAGLLTVIVPLITQALSTGAFALTVTEYG